MSPTTAPTTPATRASLGAPTTAAAARPTLPSTASVPVPAPPGWVARLDTAARDFAAQVAQLARRAVDAGRRAVAWTGTQLGRVFGLPPSMDRPTVGLIALCLVLLVVLYVATRGRAR